MHAKLTSLFYCLFASDSPAALVGFPQGAAIHALDVGRFFPAERHVRSYEHARPWELPTRSRAAQNGQEYEIFSL